MFRVGPFEGFSNLDLVKSETECARFFLDQHCMRVVLIWIRWSRDKLLSYGHVLTMRFVQHGGDELTVVSIWVQDYDRFLASVRQQGDTAKWFIKVDEICVQLLERTEDVITSITLGWHLPTKTLTQPPPLPTVTPLPPSPLNDIDAALKMQHELWTLFEWLRMKLSPSNVFVPFAFDEFLSYQTAIRVVLRGRAHLEWKVVVSGDQQSISDDQYFIDERSTIWGKGIARFGTYPLSVQERASHSGDSKRFPAEHFVRPYRFTRSVVVAWVTRGLGISTIASRGKFGPDGNLNDFFFKGHRNETLKRRLHGREEVGTHCIGGNSIRANSISWLVSFGRESRRVDSSPPSRLPSVPLPLFATRELLAVLVREQNRYHSLLYQGTSLLSMCKPCVNWFSTPSLAHTGHGGHSVCVAAARNEVLHHHRTPHWLHGRTISGKRWEPIPNELGRRRRDKERGSMHVLHNAAIWCCFSIFLNAAETTEPL